MKFLVSIEIVAEDGPGDRPVKLAWAIPTTSGDNPKFYGVELERALNRAYAAALSNIQEQFVGSPAPDRGYVPEKTLKNQELSNPATEVTLKKLEQVEDDYTSCADNHIKRPKCAGEVRRVSDPFRSYEGLKRIPKVMICERHEQRRYERAESLKD